MAARKSSVRAPRADVFSAACPSRSVLDHVSSRWGALVLVALRDGTLRFGELRRKVGGVSEKMLAQTLSGLERDGLVERTPHAVIPPRVDYELTGIGSAVSSKLEELVRLIENNLRSVQDAQKAFDAKRR